MCDFFSLVSDGKGKIMYMDWAWRKDHLQDNNDSHTYIADHFGYKGEREDTLNKYEYNPLTKKFKVDQINAHEDDRHEVEKFCNELDFSKIIEPLVIKEIINPLLIGRKEVSEEDKELLKKWASVRDSVSASVWDSVRDSVRDSVSASVSASVRDSVSASVWDSVWDSVSASVWDSVWDSVRDSVSASVWDSVSASVWDSVSASVWDSVWDSVRDSVRDSVSASVWDSVWDSVRAYASTFFKIHYDYDFEANLKLWESGLVPSFDGKTWRLHGKGGKILYEWVKP